MPFWVSVILAFASMAYFPFFLEAVFLFLLSDLLYGVPEPRLFNSTFVSFFAALICFIILELFKKKLDGVPLTKTEREYYSRSVKKKVVALANPDLHRLALKLLS